MSEIFRLEEEIEKIENAKFCLEMKDNWKIEDFDKVDEYNKQIRRLKEELEILKIELSS